MLLSIFLSNPKPEARCAMILKHAVSSLCFRTKLACKPLPLHLLQIRIRKSVKSNMRDFKHCNNHVFSPDYSSIPPAGLWRAGSVSTGSRTDRPDTRQTAGAHSAAAAAAEPPLASPASVWTGSPRAAHGSAAPLHGAARSRRMDRNRRRRIRTGGGGDLPETKRERLC